MKLCKKVLCSVLVALMILVSAPIGGFDFATGKVSAESELAESGSCGENATFTFNSETAELVISGTGAITSAFMFPGYNVKSVVIEPGITAIATFAFYSCTKLEKITIPDTVEGIGYGAFLDTAYYNNSENWVNDTLYIDKHLISYNSSDTSYNVEDGTISIATLAFSIGENCKNLKSVTIPKSVKGIADGAFTQAYMEGNLDSIFVDEDNAYFMSDDGVLFNKDKTELLQYPSAKPNDIYTIPDSVTTIKPNAFTGSRNLKSVEIPNSVINISEDAFYCSGITSVNIPDSIKSIKFETFSCCQNLKSVIIPDSVTSIDIFAFYGDTLTDIYYTGTEEEWKAISIGAENDCLTSANIHYNYHIHRFGSWYTVTAATVFGEGEEKRDCSCGEYETRSIPKLTSDTLKNNATGVELTYTADNFKSEVSLVVSENPVNANFVFGNYERFKSYNITLEANGEKIQPNGKVTVKLPLPASYDKESAKVYYVDENGDTTPLDSRIENGYIIFEIDHFSEYAIVDLSSEKIQIHEHDYTVTKVDPTCTTNGSITYTCTCGDTYTEIINPTGHTFNGSKCTKCGYDRSDDCSCNCHKSGIAHFFFVIVNFFEKLFGNNKVCDCSAKH